MELAHRRRTGLGSHGESAERIVACLRRRGFTHLLMCPPVPETAVEFDPTLSRRLARWLEARRPLYRREITDGDGVVRRYAIYDLWDGVKMPGGRTTRRMAGVSSARPGRTRTEVSRTRPPHSRTEVSRTRPQPPQPAQPRRVRRADRLPAQWEWSARPTLPGCGPSARGSSPGFPSPLTKGGSRGVPLISSPLTKGGSRGVPLVSGRVAEVSSTRPRRTRTGVSRTRPPHSRTGSRGRDPSHPNLHSPVGSAVRTVFLRNGNGPRGGPYPASLRDLVGDAHPTRRRTILLISPLRGDPGNG